MKDEYSTIDVANIFDMPVGRFREWLNNGFIIPSVQQADGPGTKNIFNFADLLLIAVLKKLVESGLSRESAAKYVNLLKEKVNKQQLGLPINENSVVLYTRNSDGEESIYTIRDGCGFIDVGSLELKHGTNIRPSGTQPSQSDWESALLINIGKAVLEIEIKVIDLLKYD